MSNPFQPITSSDVVYICVVCGSAVVLAIIWCLPVISWLLKPMKLVVIALHEFGHASACVLTGGKVEKIEVNADEGGVTEMRGGVDWVTLPAGYIGSALWGGLMVWLARYNIPSQILAGFLAAALTAVLIWADNWLLRFLILGFLAVLGGFWTLQILTPFKGLQYFVVFFGVMSCLYSIWDVWDDLIRRKVNESDASKFAEKCPICPARGWGIIWALFDFGILVGAVLAGLAVHF